MTTRIQSRPEAGRAPAGGLPARWLARLFATLLFASPRLASAGDPAAAQMLFDQARKLMSQERWAEACPKLEESQRLDPGGGTLLHLALCRDHEGRLATALAHYKDALATAKHDNRKDRAKIAQARIDALAPKVARIRVRVAPASQKLRGFQLQRDGTTIAEAQWGEAVPIDAGSHTLTARADAHKEWTEKVEVPGVATEIVVDVPALEPEAPAKDPAPPPPRSLVPTAVDPPAAEPASGSALPTVGLIVAGAGVVGLGIGGVFAFLSHAKSEDADELCRSPSPDKCQTQEGVDASKDALAYGDIATIGAIAGGALLLGGGILYFATRSSNRPTKPTTLEWRIGPGAVGLGGRF